MEVYETGQDIEYNTQNNSQKFEDNTQNGNQSEDDPSPENTSSGCGCIIALRIIMFFGFASFNSKKDAYEQHQDEPPAAQPYIALLNKMRYTPLATDAREGRGGRGGHGGRESTSCY